jgi:hypothetical protein
MPTDDDTTSPGPTLTADPADPQLTSAADALDDATKTRRKERRR